MGSFILHISLSGVLLAAACYMSLAKYLLNKNLLICEIDVINQL